MQVVYKYFCIINYIIEVQAALVVTKKFLFFDFELSKY